jgi:SAM-dependent methyltransferase
LIFLFPVPEDLGAYYPVNYYPVSHSREEWIERAKAETYKLDIVRSHVPSGKLLEIGPAYGNFAGLAQEAGFDVVTVEMDSLCCRFLEETLGIKAIHSTDVASAVATLDPVDVAALWHVVEHLPDPWGTLAALARKVRPGGILVIATPNPLAWQFRILGSKWPHVDAPRHLFLFPPDILTRHLSDIGFRVVSVTTMDKGSIGLNTIGWQTYLQNHFRRHIFLVCAEIGGRMLGKILDPIESKEGAGSAYTLVARKE